MSFWTPLWPEMKPGFSTTLLNPRNSHCNGAIRIPPDIRILRDFVSVLPFQTRLTQTKPVLPLSNEHGSLVNDQGRRQCCHNKHKKFPYWATHDVSLLSWHASYVPCLSHPLWCDHLHEIFEEYKLWSLLFSFLQSPSTSSVSGLNIFLTLFLELPQHTFFPEWIRSGFTTI